VIRRSLQQARLRLTSSLGKDPTRWTWGRLHQLELVQTPLGGDSVPGMIRSLVNRGPYDAPGGGSIVSAFAWDAAAGTFDVTAGPSMRMIVDLGNLDRSRWVNQTGNSGHPWDSHYDDQVEAWLEGRDYAWPFSPAAVQAAGGDPQEFAPAG
jgi:penicillin G amidase